MEETSDDEVITDDKVESFLMILKRLQLGLILNNKAEEVNIEEIVQDITTENQIDNDSTITKVNRGNEDTNIIEKKYPHMSERRQKEHEKYMVQQEEKKKKSMFDKESKIPILRCDANIFKNMQARITVSSQS